MDSLAVDLETESETSRSPTAARDPAIRIRGLKTAFGPKVIHQDLDLEVRRGEVLGLVGGSGTGKSVMLREMIGLMRPAAGDIQVLGQSVYGLSPRQDRALKRRMGVLFQDSALFSTLTVAQNITMVLREHTTLRRRTRDEIACLKVALAGLPADAAGKYPAELSGGMRKRAGLARALALDPELLFLDEPTAGLDPVGAAAFDQLIRSLSKTLGLTVVMVTHDLDSLFTICDRVAVLLDKRVRVGPVQQMAQEDHPWIREYFHGPRGRRFLD